MTQVVGRPTPRVEGQLKVTGKAVYSADVELPGTLWGKCLRSPISYGRIKSIDTGKARQVPGVKAVITGEDVRGLRIGRCIYDTPVVADGVVRFIGEKVAAVLLHHRQQQIPAGVSAEPGVLERRQTRQEDAPRFAFVPRQRERAPEHVSGRQHPQLVAQDARTSAAVEHRDHGVQRQPWVGLQPAEQAGQARAAAEATDRERAETHGNS